MQVEWMSAYKLVRSDKQQPKWATCRDCDSAERSAFLLLFRLAAKRKPPKMQVMTLSSS